MKHQELAGLMGSLAPTIADFVSKAMAPLRAENERLSSSLALVEQRCNDISTAREQDRVVFISLVREEIAKVEIPTKQDLLDVVADGLSAIVSPAVCKAMEEFPRPADGKDAEPVNLDEVAARAAKLVPVPANGRDATPEEIKSAVLDVVADILPFEVMAAVEKIEKPKDGKDVDPVEVAALIAAEVAKIELAKDGKDGEPGRSVDMIELATIVEQHVESAALRMMPSDGKDGAPGIDGKSVTVDEVRPVLAELVAALPVPENGRDPDPQIIRAMVVEEVAKIERPKDGEPGKGVELDDLIPAIETQVKSAVLFEVAKIVVPQGAPGEPGKSVTMDEVRPVLEALVAALPKPQDGRDAVVDPMEVANLLVDLMPVPIDGKSVTADEVRPMLEELVAALPRPENGKDAVIDPVEIAKLLVDLMPAPVDGKSITPDDVRPMLEQMVAVLPKPENGKDADPVEIAALIIDDVAKMIPVPVDGKSVTIEDVRPVLAEMVAALPSAKDGKDIDPEIVAKMLGEMVEAGLKTVPAGIDGKSVTVDDVRPMIEELFAAIPTPQNGKDADPVEVASLIIEDVARLIPKPEDGKSVSVDDVRPMLQEMVDALPVPQNGKDADPVEVASLIIEDVAKLIPPPSDGKSVTLEEITPLVEEAASKQLPASFLINEEGNLVSVYRSGDTKSVGKVRGDDGLRGASVMDGHVEEDGTLVLRMSDGRILQTGIVRGEPGLHGNDGQKGERGRDAHEIQILPGIDENKSYIEGVIASWRGGLIRSERQTDPIIDGNIVAAGWKAVLRGVAEERVSEVDDGRYIERTIVYTDGTEFATRTKTATPIDRGVWREGDYLKGDGVTWAGSFFIAQRDTSDKPQQSDAWRLSVKRGRDGKDGKDGKIIDRSGPPIVKIDPDKR